MSELEEMCKEAEKAMTLRRQLFRLREIKVLRAIGDGKQRRLT